MRIVLDVVPSKSTAQGKRFNFKTGHVFQDKKEKTWTQMLTALLQPHRPDSPIEGPIRLDVIFVWPLTQGDESTKAKRLAREWCDRIWHPQYPDWDNAPKALIDVMTHLGFWKDDKQIVDGRCRKLRGKKPCVIIEFGEIDYMEMPPTLQPGLGEPEHPLPDHLG